MSLPYDTYPQVLKVINAIAEGKTESSACMDAQISVRVFRSAVRANTQLQELHEEAQVLGYDRMAEILLTIDRDTEYGQSDAKMAKVISDNIKWLLEKRKPKEYGQRVDVNVNITADRAIVDVLSRARARAIGETIEAEYQEVKEIAPPQLSEEATFLMEIGAYV